MSMFLLSEAILSRVVLDGNDSDVIAAECAMQLDRIANLLQAEVDGRAKKRKPKQANLLPELTPQEKVGRFELDADLLAWGKQKCPSVPMGTALDDWKLSIASRDYLVSGRPMKDARATFMTYCRNAEKHGDYTRQKRADRAASSAGMVAPRHQVEEKPL